MKTKLALGGCVAASIVCAALALAKGEKGPDLKEVAKKLVGTCAGVHEKDVVAIRGDVRDIDLLEEVSLEVSRAGGVPVLLVGREAYNKRYYAEVPEKYDPMLVTGEQKLVDMADVMIFAGGTESPALLKDVPPARLSAVDAAMTSTVQARMKKGMRVVALGNSLFPTDATAKQYGMTRAQLAKIFWDGVNVDYTKLQATGEAVRAAFVGAKELRLVAPNGTDLRVKVGGSTPYVSDGVISADDVKKGGAATQIWLPAGEAYLAVVPGTAEGKVVVDHMTFEDGDVEGLTWVFKAGKSGAPTAKPGKAFDRLLAYWQTGTAGKDELSIIDVGINSAVKAPAGSKLQSWVAAGTVTVVTGGNTWANGTNTSSFSTAGFLHGATLEVDGKPLVEKGELKLPGVRGGTPEATK